MENVKDSKLDRLSNFTNRSYYQTEYLFNLCGKDYNKLYELECKIKANFINYVPSSLEEVEVVLNLDKKLEYESSDVVNQKMLELFNDMCDKTDTVSLVKQLKVFGDLGRYYDVESKREFRTTWFDFLSKKVERDVFEMTLNKMMEAK